MSAYVTEKAAVSRMIAIYCRGRHGGRTLCEECRQLEEYAHARIERCPQYRRAAATSDATGSHRTQKGFCSHCPNHCYRPDMRERIRCVMRYSGPRMLLYNPPYAIRHVMATIRHKLSTGRNDA